MADKYRQMEDEMSRFEAEIANAQTYATNAYGHQTSFTFGNIPSMIPHQLRANRGGFEYHHQPFATAQPAVVSAKPTLYVPAKTVTQSQSDVTNSVNFLALQNEVQKKLKQLKEKVSVPAELAISQGKASRALQSFRPDPYRRQGKDKKLMRIAGGQTWEDSSLGDWCENDFRIFCGDLGNDVTDELLTKTFKKYPSFMRARVIRDKRTNKTKGYGFVSFKDPADFTKAMKEMNGHYVGSRPIKLKKSSWKNRCFEVVKKKEKEKTALLKMVTGGNNQ